MNKINKDAELLQKNENLFKTPQRRNTLRRNQDNVIKDQPVTPSIRKVNIVPRSNSVKINKVNTATDDLEERFKSQASLRFITDEYFNVNTNKSKRPKSSNKSMASLGRHRLTPEQASALLIKMDPTYCSAEISQRIETLKRQQFPRMIYQLLAGYNILMYGFGSKMKLLDCFHQKYLLSESSVVVAGFSPDVTLQMVLSDIIDTYLLNVKVTSRSIVGMAESIKTWYDDPSKGTLYIVIHNIDGRPMRNSANIFSILTECRGIRIIASVDHIHSGLMWTQNDFDWICHDCTTLEPYLVETRVDNARLMLDKVQQGLSSLTAVIGSLNSQAKAVFLHLAKYQLQQSRDNKEGMSLDKLYGVCKENMLVNSETALRTHLIEFRDHKLVNIRQGMDRSDFIRILLDEGSIKDFVENFTE